MFSWIKENTDINDHFMFWRPRTVRLMTGRVGTAPIISDIQKKSFGQRIYDYKIKYVILAKKSDLKLIAMLSARPDFADLAWENQLDKIFAIL